MCGAGVRVLVVGAGVAGLAAARTLRGWGAEVEVVERTPSTTSEGTGIYLLGNAMRALHELGLADAVAGLGVRIRRQRFADHRGRVLAEVDTAGVWGAVGDCLSVPRPALHRVLLAGADDVPIRWGLTPRTIATEHDRVTVTLSDGTTDQYAMVVGADGVHSTVRRLVLTTAPARLVGQHARRFVVRLPGLAPVWSVQLGPGSSFLTIPIGDDQVYCYCDGPPHAPPLRELLSDYSEPVPSLLDALERAEADDDATVHAGPIEEVALDRWSRGRVLLIGDAAHATAPNMAQGAAMALEDALVLAECLSAADSIAEAQAAYEHRRRPRTDWVLRQTHRRDRTRELPAAIRDLVIRRLGRRIYHANYRPLLAPP